MSSDMTGVSIIVPTRNEADNIEPLLRRLLPVVMPDGLEREIIFVDDSSSDATRDIIQTWCSSESVRLICRDESGGLASAVVAGAHEARFDVVVVMDADLSHPPEVIPDLLRPLLDRTHDMVIGSRYIEGGTIPQWPLSRKIASRLACMPARLFTGVNDPMAGFFATSRQRLANARQDIPGFKVGFEILATAEDGFRVAEVPIVFSDRFEGFSKMNKQIIFDYLSQLLQLGGVADMFCKPLRFGVLASLAAVLNWLVFSALLRVPVVPSVAQLSGFAISVLGVVMALPVVRKDQFVGCRITGLQCSALLIAALCALAVQEALFSCMTELLGEMDPLVAFVPASIAGILFFLLPAAFVLTTGFGSLAVRVRLRFGAVGAILVIVLLRLVYLGLPELMEQEAYYWNYAQHPALSYLDHPPLVAILIRIGTELFGTTEFGVRIGAFCCWFVTAFFMHRLTALICGRTAALGSVVLVAALPYYFGIGLMMTPDAPLHAAWAAALYFLYRAMVDGRADAWLGVGISIGIGLLAKYTIVLLGPAALCFMLVDRRARLWLIRAEPFGALLLAVLLFLPVLIWNYQHEWVSFLFQSQDRLTGQHVFTTHRLLGYIALNLTPAGLLGLYLFLTNNGRRLNAEFWQEEIPVAGNEFQRRYRYLWLMVIVPLSIFVFFSLTREVKLNWTSPLWLAVIPLFGGMVLGVAASGRSLLQTVMLRTWQWTIVLLILVYAVGLHYVVFGFPGLPYSARPFLVGWQNFARQIDHIVDDIEQQTGSRPIVVGMDPYQISSALAFYRAKNASGLPAETQRLRIDETVGWHLFTWDGLMYEYWANPADLVGRDVLAVATSRIRVEYPYFQNRLTSLGAIQQLPVTKDGQQVRTMYFRLVRGYRFPAQ